MQQNNFLLKHYRLTFYFLFVVGLILSFMYANNQILSGDQTQMLFKGYMGAHNGTWIHYGNAASAVGNVPGSLSSYIVGIPLVLIDSPWSPMIFLIFLRIIGFFLIDHVIKNIFSQEIRLTFLVLYWLNPWFLFENILYNPTYLFFFAALHFWSAYKMHSSKNFWYSFWHVLSIGMALQLHYSWILLVFISLYLFYKRSLQINWYGIFTAGAVVIASLIPYFYELLNNQAISASQHKDDKGRYIGWGAVHVYPIFKALIYWVRYASFIFTNKLVLGASFEWVTSIESLQTIIKYTYRTIVFSLGALTILITLKANWYVWQQVKKTLFTRNDQNVNDKQWLLIYMVGAFFAIIISAALSPIVFNYWHLIMIFPFTLIPLLFFFDAQQKRLNKYFSNFIYAIVGYLLVINLLGMHDSEKFSYKANYTEQVTNFIGTSLQD
jgi:hypothetical protein